jgi:hypothetical protein
MARQVDLGLALQVSEIAIMILDMEVFSKKNLYVIFGYPGLRRELL